MNNNKRLLFAVLIVFIFCVVIIVWYFYYARPAIAPSLNTTNNPLPTQAPPPRFSFLTWGQDQVVTSTTEITDPLAEPLVEVWNKPAVGQTFITQEILKEVIATTTQGTSTVEVKRMVRATSTVLIFVDKMTGYIYGYPLETGKIYQITNSIVPGVYDAHFLLNGRRVVLSSIDVENNETTTIVATVPSVPQGGEAKPFTDISNLPSDITSVSVNNQRDRFSYVVKTPSGNTFYTVTPAGTLTTATSPFREWNIAYGGETLYATTKASAYVPGVTAILPSFSIKVDSRTGLLTVPGPAGDLLNSMWSQSGLLTFITSSNVDTVLPIRTLAPKCSWGSNDLLVCAVPRSLPRSVEGMPDDWYQGSARFSDDLVLADKNTGEVTPLYTFRDNLPLFDIEKIVVLRSNDYYSFIRKQNGSLWLLNTNLLGD